MVFEGIDTLFHDNWILDYTGVPKRNILMSSKEKSLSPCLMMAFHIVMLWLLEW